MSKREMAQLHASNWAIFFEGHYLSCHRDSTLLSTLVCMSLLNKLQPRILVSLIDGRVSSVSSDTACVVIVEDSNGRVEIPVVVHVSTRDMDQDLEQLQPAVPLQTLTKCSDCEPKSELPSISGKS